ncbi:MULTISPECIES: hypothetical protein [Leptolyngbya]|jgi:hypothetical protein|uniref:Uncharacterized protein n=2 Tax=Leptolyngbya boryana TaxID=1184 RepID=A0A1Z4JNU8_LEPBY|nr:MULTISPECIES: hypothetical protein [Leptolyngbya]BAY58380.1 hypothetical protein NIES2135_52530 [Leptolyngbya boryana NIES-2135]MBD2368054.1 hypothetical protein [Leptolyngbya sp. FACHB-161]MBD2374578.1 hypothetical protein [Leptolyngbya sp. FACHB-238]MBD2399000.1 hypothetical protein [Leptolyngbya sp. FACHB-239]MBD2405389.1 hypothetical protein [Leptolyngbya sp. FACHB-402]
MADAQVRPVLHTLQEVDEAVRRYNATDWQTEEESLPLWQAIRDASLEQLPSQKDPFKVPGEDSY